MGVKRYVDQTFQSGADILGPPGRIVLPSTSPANEADIGYDTTADQVRFKNGSNVCNLGPLVNIRTADGSNITTGTADDLTVTLPNVGTYYFEAWVQAVHKVATCQPSLGINGTCTPSLWRWQGRGAWYATTVADNLANGTTTFSAPAALTAFDANLIGRLYAMQGLLTVTAVGTFTIRGARASVGSTAWAFGASSFLKVMQVS